MLADARRALARSNFLVVLAFSLAMLVLGSSLITLVEASGRGNIKTFGDAVWYTLVTMATVGYGDYVPTTGAGRAIGIVLILGGVTLFSILTGTVASVFVARRIKEERGLESVRSRDHLLVCGWNPYAERVLDSIHAASGGSDVVLVNELPEESAAEVLARQRGRSVRFVRGDPASEAVLERANVRHAQAAIVLADASRPTSAASDDRATLVTLALKSLKPDLHVTVEALDLKSQSHLRRAGADDIVISGEFNAFLLSSAATSPGISDVVRPLLSVSGSELRRVTLAPEYVGRTYGEVASALRAKDGFQAIAVVHENPGLTLDQLLSDDTSMVDRFIKSQFSEAGREFLRFEGEPTRVIVNPADEYEIGPHDAVVGIGRPA